VVSPALAPCVPVRLHVLGSLPVAEARGPVVCGSQLRSVPFLPVASPSPRRPRTFALLHAEIPRPGVTWPLTPTECGAGRCRPAFLIYVLYRARTRGLPSRFTLTGQPLQRHLAPTPYVDPPPRLYLPPYTSVPSVPPMPGEVCLQLHPAAQHEE
jgi:hypothetical protein